MVSPLEISNLVKNYGAVQAVRGVSFSVKPGEVFGLLGPNGAGKTSIISIVTTLEKATSGEAKIFGESVHRGPKSQKLALGTVPQEVINHGFFDVEEILKFHSGYYGIWSNKERIKYLLDRLGLWSHRHKKVKQLSGGMKRRLMIAKALVHSPKVLLLDEPTAGVDVELRASLWEFVRELKSEGMSILLTTHYLEEAESLCDRIGIINHGELKLIGETRDIIRRLTQREVRLQFSGKPPVTEHPDLLSATDDSLTFLIAADRGIGDLLAGLGLSLEDLKDVRIKEGSLEDVFIHVLGEKA